MRIPSRLQRQPRLLGSLFPPKDCWAWHFFGGVFLHRFAAQAPQLLRKKSGKFASASYLHLVDAAKTKQLWRMTAPKPAASETDIDTYVLQPPQIQEVQPERPLFDRIVSDNVLLQLLG